MKKLILLIFVTLLVFFVQSQNKQTIDSLQKIVTGNFHDTSKISALNNLGMNYYLFDLKKAKYYWDNQLDLISKTAYKADNTKEKYFYNSSKANAFGCIAYVYQCWGNLDSAIFFSNSCLLLSKKIGDMETLASVLNNMGVIYNYKGDIANALHCYEQSYHLQDSLGKNKGAAMALNNIALIYRSQGDVSKALDYHFRSLKISEKINDAFSMGHAYNNIGIIYRSNGEFKKGMEFFHKSYDIRKTINDLNGMALALNEIGVGFSQTKQYDSALFYHKMSFELRVRYGDSTYIAQSLVNIGVIYVSEKKYNEALEYFNKALVLKKITQEQQGIADAYGHIGGTYYLMKQYDKAEENSSKALRIAQQLKFPSEIERASEKLSLIFAEQGKYKKAYEMHLLFKQMSDSIFNENNRKATYKQQLKYDFDKKAIADSIVYAGSLKIKDLELAKKIEESKKQKVIIYSFVFVFLIIFIFSIIIYRFYIEKKKANRLLSQQNFEIIQQKEEIIVQRDNIQEQKEIIEEHQKEIQDSINYAKRIQQAVMPDLNAIASCHPEHVEGEAKQSINDVTHQIASPLVCNDTQIDFFIFFRPKDIVSGDFYWSTRIEEILIITVADCTGHGIPGAFMSMLGISFLNEIVRKKELTKASEVLDELRTSVIDALQQKGDSGEQKDGMDIALCAINMKTLEMQFAGANNPVWIVNQFENLKMNQFGNVKTETGQFPNFQINAFPNLIELKGDKQPIGIHTNMQPFTNQTYQLQKGDTIYLMSDGFEDQFGGPNRKKFLSKNLKNLLIANSQQRCIEPACPDKSVVEMPMAVQKQILETTINEWIGDGEQIDDITVLGLKI